MSEPMIVICPKCGTKNRLSVSGTEGLIPRCGNCKADLRAYSPSVALTPPPGSEADRLRTMGAVTVMTGKAVGYPAGRPQTHGATQPVTRLHQSGGYGQIRQLAGTPIVAEILVLDLYCSSPATRSTPFQHLYARFRLGEQFRLVEADDPDAYLRRARDAGVGITRGNDRIIDLRDLYVGNFQCTICGHGEIAGSSTPSFFRCGACGKLSCGRSILQVKNAASTSICGNCGRTEVCIGEISSLSGVRYIATDRPR